MSSAQNILISAAGRRVELLGLFRSAQEEIGIDGEVLVGDSSRSAPALHVGAPSIRLPRCDDPQFVDTVIEICLENDVTLLVPTIDPELELLGASRDRFERAGILVAASGPETSAICADKVKTNEWLRANSFPAVRQTMAANLLIDAARWRFPIILKPPRGSAGIGVQIAYDLDEVDHRVRREPDVLAEVLLTGTETTVDVFVDADGRAEVTVPRRRLAVRGGEVVKAMTVRDHTIESLVRDIAERLPDAYGPLNVQLFESAESGGCRIIELNSRFGGGYPLSARAGARFHHRLVEESAGVACSGLGSGWNAGVTMLRYDQSVFVDTDDISW